MDTNGAIHVSPSSRPSSTTHSRQPSTLYHDHHSGLNSPNQATFIAPPPPPPLGTRSNTHSRQTSRVDGTRDYIPINTHSHRSMNHARIPSASSWIPPPPPPPIGIPHSSGLSPQSAFSPLGSALQLSLSPPGRAPSLKYNDTPQISTHVDRETQSTSQASQAHHSRTKSATVPTHYIPSNSSLNQTHTHVVQAVNYNSPTSQFITSRPFVNAPPFPIISNNTHNPGSHPSNHLGNPHTHGQPLYTYQNSAQFTPGVVSNNMLLTHSPTPFERGPFAASSVPPQHALLSLRPPNHARSPSLSRSHSPQQSTPPPPRPPKPPELELEYVPAATTTTTSPPTLPERLQTFITPNIHRGVGVPTVPARERLDVGEVESPTLSGASASATRDTGGHGREDVNASGSNVADGGDKLSGSLPANEICQVKPSIERTIDQVNGHPRQFGDLTRTNTFGASSAAGRMGQPELAVDSQANDVLRERGGMLSTGDSGSGQGSSNTSTAVSASGDARTTRVLAGDDGVEGTNEEGQGDIDDMRSDSGMTMDGYDPNAFDFPRRVNDEMANILSPTTQTFPSSIVHGDDRSNAEPTTTLSPEEESSRNQHPTMEVETEAPPTYDEVELESQLIQSQTPTTPVGAPSRPGAPRFPAPTFPPPAFRPETPPSPGGSTTTGTTAHPTPTRAQFQHSQHTNVPGGPHLAPQNPGNRTAAPTRPLSPPPLTQNVSTGNREHSASESSSGHGHDGLMMTSRGDAPGPSTHAAQPAIYTSPPTPSPRHSPSDSITRSPTFLKSLRISLPRRFTTSGEDDSLGSRSPTSEASDPFQDPPSFQADSSPFALNHNGGNDSPRSVPTEIRSQSPMSDMPQVDGNFGRAATGKGRSRSYSGFWSNVSSTPPTPKSDLASHELGRRHPEESSNGPQAVVSAESAKAKRRTTLGGSGSRLSLFFKSSPVSGSGPSNGNGIASGSSARSSQVPRAGGVDLLDDGTLGPTWQEAWGRMPSPSAGLSDPTRSFGDGGSPGDEGEHSVLMDLWEGIEFGFGAPGWNTPPAPGPYSNPTEWPEGITLYPVGSKPFFVRAPTWRSLLRFLASQSTLRIEPSVEALATSATPTIDLRLVVQFARTPYTPRGTTRDVCLYMMLHTKMPALSTRSGRALPTEDRAALENWDTRALPYSFVCAKGGLLARHGVTAAKPNVAAGASELRGTPIADQDPDGEDSMFITIPPPFIELPVKMSDIAMYLHECLVLSRKNGKQTERPKTAQANSGLAPNHGHKLRKGHGSTSHLPMDGLDSKASHTTASGVHVSTPLSTNLDSDVASSSQQESLSTAPGLKRLAKAVKTFYPDEYAIGSSRANQAAEQAAVEEDHYKGKMMGVKKGKGTSSGKGGGLLGAFQRVRSKSSAAKQTVTGLSTGVAGARGPGRDTNAERFELVTPWRGE